jgi:lipopolysaccharide transport system ATP-binding protein
MSDTVIKVENLGKKYILSHQQEGRSQYRALRDVIADGASSIGRKMMSPFGGQPVLSPEKEEFWALKDVSFEIKRGDRVGIIGRNGAGKSTLLKILSRITEPTTGRIQIIGRVASLLEVGTGFHPELTGRENIFLNGSVLGMKKEEITRKFDEIVDFAEVEKFLDTPVKRYSSGMYVRLAFAVAAHLEPEILVVDEVLAVGDAQFQKKCLGKMNAVGKDGKTVLFVSHSMSAISSLCNTAILFENGSIVQQGNTSEVVINYFSGDNSSKKCFDARDVGPRKIGDEDVELISSKVTKIDQSLTLELDICEEFQVEMLYKIKTETTLKFVPNFHFYTSSGSCVFVTSSPTRMLHPKGKYLSICKIPGNFLNDGVYFIGIAISSFEKGATRIHFFERDALTIHMKDDMINSVGRNGWSGVIPGTVRPELEWDINYV